MSDARTANGQDSLDTVTKDELLREAADWIETLWWILRVSYKFDRPDAKAFLDTLRSHLQ